MKRSTLDYATPPPRAPEPNASGSPGCTLTLTFLAGVLTGVLLLYFLMTAHGMG